MRALLCRLSVAVALTGCVSPGDDLEIAGQGKPLVIADDALPAPEVSANPSALQQGMRYLALPGGRVLRASDVLRLVDLRDPQRPRTVSQIHGYSVSDDRFYALANHAIYRGATNERYHGEREDVTIPRVATEGLLNVDYSDPTQLRLVNIVPGAFWPLAQGQGSAGGAVYAIEHPDPSLGVVYLGRYELQDDGELVLTGQLPLPAEVARLETAGSKVLITFQIGSKPARIAVVEGSGPDLQIVYETSVPGFADGVNALRIDGPKLRVTYARRVQQGGTTAAVDTFDLTKDDALGRVGRCELAPADILDDGYYTNARLYSQADHMLFASDRAEGVSYQIPFSAAGTCPLRRVLSYQKSRAFQVPTAQRLFSVENDELRLYDTSRRTTQPPLANAGLSNINSYSYADRPIHVFELTRAATAHDGTPEPWLVGLPYSDETPTVIEGLFQLFTASDRTVTARSTITQFAFAGDLALYDSTLVTLSSESLRTYDIRDLAAPKPLGTVDFHVVFNSEFRFGDHLLRVRSPPQGGAPTGADPMQELVLDQLDAIGTPVATWPIREDRQWLKAEDLLLEARWINTSSALSPYFLVQIYDLSDPGRPRGAGVFFSDEIAKGAAGYSPFGLTMRTIGRSLAIAQRAQPGGPWSVLKVIDLRDPDDPKLYESTELPQDVDFTGLDKGVAQGSNYFFSQMRSDGRWYGTRIGIEPDSLPGVTVSVIPAPIVAATPEAVYTATDWLDPADLTVSRLAWRYGDSPPTAARTWPGRKLTSLRADGGPYVYLTHRPGNDPLPQSVPNSDWVRLEVLDAVTLATVGALDLDLEGTIQDSAQGRLLIAIPDALLFVDVRDPTQPTARAAVPFDNYGALTTHDDVVYVASRSVRSYPIDLRNLAP